MDSPQTPLPSRRSQGSMLNAITRGEPASISMETGKPVMITSAGLHVFKSSPGVIRRWIQNVGTVALFVFVGKTSTHDDEDLYDTDAAAYVLKADTGADAGAGGFIDLSWFSGDVYIAASDSDGYARILEAFGEEK